MAGLTFKRAYALLNYDPSTGVLTWKANRGQRTKAGDVAGFVCSRSGYVLLKTCGVQTGAHRVAWLLATGDWPIGEIDHINGQRNDNRRSNLRDVDKIVNGANRHRANKNCTSGVLGVHKHRSGKWQAAMRRDGATRYLGLFDSIVMAGSAFVSEASKWRA
jgi:hypothetical protein